MLVKMADVEAAIQEMFQAPHIQVSAEGTPCGVILIFILVDGGISCRLHDNKEEPAFFLSSLFCLALLSISN